MVRPLRVSIELILPHADDPPDPSPPKVCSTDFVRLSCRAVTYIDVSSDPPVADGTFYSLLCAEFQLCLRPAQHQCQSSAATMTLEAAMAVWQLEGCALLQCDSRHCVASVQMAAHQLLMHFSSAVQNSALLVAKSHAVAGDNTRPPDLHKAQYVELCKLIPAERFLGCLVDLCQALWQVMCSYWAVLTWHRDREPAGESLLSEDIEARYVIEKLRGGLQRVWQDIQKKVTQFLLASNIAGFKFNQFIQVLDIVRRCAFSNLSFDVGVLIIVPTSF
ncbi:hypothetical protein HPB51_019879 [Rhipicephalus microplus]|uniref:Vacuolar protein sorting-associated protein 54 N-terminal domain-containing protein n=1 Tax=Rhipicephalus microplus TaxID=6941 RepID=A0A9J6D6Y6_RHIMP|nr:hypothetical protein HPB51_019879 [Rhipicephalus microplus]